MYTGLLKIKESSTSIEYCLYSKYEFNNISETMNGRLMDSVRIEIKVYEQIHIFEGKLLLVRENGIYKYMVGNKCLDDLLWNNVGEYMEFDLVVIKGAKEDDDEC